MNKFTKDQKNKTELLHWKSEDDVHQVAQLLKSNKLVLGTTDTVLGLFAPVTQEGFGNLNRAKGRFEKPYLILIGSRDRIHTYTDLESNSPVWRMIRLFWPGPLTIIFKGKKELSPFLLSSTGTVALRMPAHQGIQTLLPHSGDLFSTSANLAGGPIPLSLEEVDTTVLASVGACIVGDTGKTIPSTIIDCTDSTKISVVRQGAIPAEELGISLD